MRLLGSPPRGEDLDDLCFAVPPDGAMTSLDDALTTLPQPSDVAEPNLDHSLTSLHMPIQIAVGSHYLVRNLEAKAVAVVRVVAFGQAPDTVVAIPCKRTRLRTFRQGSVDTALELPIANIIFGPFRLVCGRAPAKMWEHFLKAQASQLPEFSSSCPQARRRCIVQANDLGPTVPKPRFLYGGKWRQLKAMGFKDEARARDLLMLHSGNLCPALNELLQEQRQTRCLADGLETAVEDGPFPKGQLLQHLDADRQRRLSAGGA